MDMSDATEGAPFWQLHIAAWQQSGLTQKAYCEHQELRYSTFGYWGLPAFASLSMAGSGGAYHARVDGFVSSWRTLLESDD